MGLLPTKFAQYSVVVGLIACLGAGCSSTGPGDGSDPSTTWYVSGGAGLQDQAFGLTISGIQLLIDGKVVYSRSENPTIVMVAGFSPIPLAVGNHTMSLKVLGQQGTSVTYVVTGLIDMSLGQTGTETRSFHWPDQVKTLRVGDVVEFPFKVPL